MPLPRGSLVLALVLTVWTVSATAQQPTLQLDSARPQIHTRLRAFYFSLAHQDWEALTADILAAKVVAHRPVPQTLMLTASAASAGTPKPGTCSTGQAALVDQAVITLANDWAEVSVPRCTATLAGSDEFRLIHFENRWRFVYVALFREPLNVSTER